MNPHQAPSRPPAPLPREARTSEPLRNTLRLNAVTSMLGGMVALVGPGSLDRLLGTGHPGAVRIVGAGLVGFAAAVLAVAGSSTDRLRRWTREIVAADVGWVAVTGVTVGAGWFSAPGGVVAGAVGVMVATFAARQHRRLGALAE